MTLQEAKQRLLDQRIDLENEHLLNIFVTIMEEAFKIRLVYHNDLAKDHLFDTTKMDEAVKELGELSKGA